MLPSVEPLAARIIAKGQQELAEELRRRAVSVEGIDRMLASGYYLRTMSPWGTTDPQPYIADSFYGSKMFSGMVPIDRFLGCDLPAASVPKYTVGSLADIETALTKERHARFHRLGKLSFRGQAREYLTQRPYPSQTMAEAGAERLIIPSFWRRFRDDWSRRFQEEEPPSIFTTNLGNELVYEGIPEWRTLAERNFERYGPHSMSDLEDFPDPESREYGRRWKAFKVLGGAGRELPLVEQHYGFETCGLDLTFDIAVAAFFAANPFVPRDDGTAHYVAPPKGDHKGVIYGFVFRDPPLRRQEELIGDVPVFSHIPPVRPIRQHCALPFFHALNFNEAACDLDLVLHLSPDFDPSGLPDQRHLFPLPADDPFYDAALKARQKAPEGHPYREFIEYRFE